MADLQTLQPPYIPLHRKKNAETIDLHTLPTLHTKSLRDAKISHEMNGDCIEENPLLDESGSKICKARLTPTFEPVDDGCKVSKVCKAGDGTIPTQPSSSETVAVVTAEEFAEQIRKAIANFDQALAIQVWDGLKAKVKRKLREEVKSHLTPRESENFKILVTVGFLLDMQVKYVGDTQYAQQYEGMVLEVYGMDEYAQITCRKPDGYLTTRMKPEELEKL